MTKAVFFGASSVEGVGASTPERRFTALIARALNWQEINLGIGGTTVTGRDDTGQVIAQESGLARVPDVLETEPDLVIIHYGANDFAQSCPLGAADVFRQGTFYWDYDTMLRGLLGTLSPDKIVLSTAQYRADALEPNALGLTLPDYNRVILQMGDRYELKTLDPYTNSDITPNNYAKLSSDAAHLNDLGYEHLAAFFVENLR